LQTLPITLSIDIENAITTIGNIRTVILGREIPAAELRALERSMSITHDIVNKIFKAFAFNDPVLNRLCYRNTRDYNSYGYFINPDLHHLYEFIIRLDADSVLDLGCGACIALEIVRVQIDSLHSKKVKFGGIEIEAPLIKLAHAMFPDTYSIEQADLMKLERRQIEKYDIIYLWEPIYNEEAAGVFVDQLVGLLHVNQTIVMKPNGSIAGHLVKHPKITELNTGRQALALFHLKDPDNLKRQNAR